MEDAERDAADLWLINSCTVKGPSQAGMSNLIAAGKAGGKRVVVAGCVPQVRTACHALRQRPDRGGW